MDADVRGALRQINKSWKAFVHNGKPMTKEQVKIVLKYALSKGYESTKELSDEEVNQLINAK